MPSRSQASTRITSCGQAESCYVVGSVRTDHPKAIIVRRDTEFLTERNDIRIHLNGGDRGVGQTPVAEFRQRAAAQAEQQDCARVRD